MNTARRQDREGTKPEASFMEALRTRFGGSSGEREGHRFLSPRLLLCKPPGQQPPPFHFLTTRSHLLVLVVWAVWGAETLPSPGPNPEQPLNE